MSKQTNRETKEIRIEEGTKTNQEVFVAATQKTQTAQLRIAHNS